MKLPRGIAPVAGMVAGGRRLAVRCVHFGDGVEEEALLGVRVSSADMARRKAWSELAPQPVSATASATPRRYLFDVLIDIR
ncbi:MAG: hypothetical protein ACTHMY_08375 [Solirubrobacteraceae bacterium]